MNEYFFLFGLAIVWVIFAVVQDFRSREVSNWLNFSLISFVLAYRAIYSIISKDIMFFVLGALGVLFFVIIAYALYYGRAFAGGDAKLLMGLGGIFPYVAIKDIFFIGVGFVFILFLAGAVYSLLYTAFLVFKNKESFGMEFKKQFLKYKLLFASAIILAFIFQALIQFYTSDVFGFISILIVLFPLILIYVKAVESSCMIKLISPERLGEGDWLMEDVRVGGKTIKKTVHGLTLKDIHYLKIHKKKVWVREGIPFTPAFLFALIMVFFWLF